MNERELATKIVAIAKRSMNSFNANIQTAILDYQEHFGNGDYDLRRFTEECDKLGFDVFPIEVSVLSKMPLVGKLVVQNKGAL